MNIPEKQSTVKLTHFGRKSGKPFNVTIWFTVIGGDLWIGSLDENRNWVKNLRATGKARLDFGSGPQDVVAEFSDSDNDRARYADAVSKKYWLLSRVIEVFVRGGRRAVFLVKPA